MRSARLLVLGLAIALTPAAGQAEVADGKRALIVELIALSAGPQNTVAHQFLGQLQPLYGSWVRDLMGSEEELEPARRAALQEHLSDFDAFSVAFMARFPKEVDVEAVLVDTYVPLYDRYFDEAELTEIVAFYRSEAGRKMMRVLPQLIQEGVTGTLRRIEPELLRLVGLVLVERRQAFLYGDGSP
jgi:hypothetical protein